MRPLPLVCKKINDRLMENTLLRADTEKIIGQSNFSYHCIVFIF